MENIEKLGIVTTNIIQNSFYKYFRPLVVFHEFIKGLFETHSPSTDLVKWESDFISQNLKEVFHLNKANVSLSKNINIYWFASSEYEKQANELSEYFLTLECELLKKSTFKLISPNIEIINEWKNFDNNISCQIVFVSDWCSSLGNHSTRMELKEIFKKRSANKELLPILMNHDCKWLIENTHDYIDISKHNITQVTEILAQAILMYCKLSQGINTTEEKGLTKRST